MSATGADITAENDKERIGGTVTRSGATNQEFGHRRRDDGADGREAIVMVGEAIRETAAERQPDMQTDSRLRRAMLIAARDEAQLQDQIACAELAMTAGLRADGEAFYGLVLLQLGFSPAGLAMGNEIRRRTGLWPDLPDREPGAAAAGFCVDVAVAELRRLMRLHPALPPVDDGATAVLPKDTFSPAEPGVAPAEAPLLLAARVMDVLRSVPRRAADDGLGDMLREIADEVVALQPLMLEERLGRTLSEFAALYALERLRMFLLASYEILTVLPAGSPLFDQAARLDRAALGPYFANVRLVMRDVRDIFALIELAAGGEPTYDAIECWSVLISGRLSRDETAELADELADRGMTRALRVLLARAARSSAADKPRTIVWRIRDVALDIGDRKLAADAQHVIATWARLDANEWFILGTIRAAEGDRIGAEAALSRALFLAPDRGDVRDRVAAFRSGGAFVIERGYATTPGRLKLRRARLQAFGRAIPAMPAPLSGTASDGSGRPSGTAA